MTFKSTSIVFLLSLCFIGLLNYFCEVNLLWLILPFLVYNILIVYGSATIQSNFFIRAFCNSNTTEKVFAITFDDGPHNIYTPKVLDILAEYNAKATFFVIGKKIRGNEPIIKQIDDGGHSIGNHTYSHSFFIDFKSKNGFMNEIDHTAEEVFKITEKRIVLFRPPYGVTTPNLASAARELNYKIIGWNVRSMDTTGDSIETIFKRVKEQLKPGAVVLFHDTSEKTIEVLKQTLNFAEENGYKIVSVEELLKLTV